MGGTFFHFSSTSEAEYAYMLGRFGIYQHMVSFQWSHLVNFQLSFTVFNWDKIKKSLPHMYARQA